MGFSVDGVEWPVEIKVERLPEVRESDLSGTLVTGTQFRDILGTFLRFRVTITVPYDMRSEYAALYELLTDPVDGHVFVLPYNSTEITVTGAVKNFSDLRYPLPDGGSYWAGGSFDVEANHPTKFLSLDEVLARGGAPLPDLSEGVRGDYWHCEGPNDWEHGNYPDYSESYW